MWNSCTCFRPFDLPREFSGMFVCIVCVPLSGNAARAATHIVTLYTMNYCVQLVPVWCPNFHWSLDSHTVPALCQKWASSCRNNDFRHIASIELWNALKNIWCLLKTQVNKNPWQFVYKCIRSRGVAISITHLVLKHLDTKVYACLLFIDFSSAINEAQPFLLHLF